MPSGMNVKGKTIILTNPNMMNQKNVILQSIGPGGNPIYQQIPISNMTNIAGLRGATIVTGPPSLVKAGEQNKNNQMPALVPTSNNLSNNIQGIQGLRQVVMQTSNAQQTMPTLTNHVQIRPMMGNMPQGQLTLIQRPGQQPQLVQTIQQAPQTMQRAIITQQPHQTIQIQQQQQPTIVQTSQPATTATTTQSTQRRGLSLSVSTF